MAPVPPAPSPQPSGPATPRSAPGSPPPWTATGSSPTRTPGSAASSPTRWATSGPQGTRSGNNPGPPGTGNQAASVPSATVSTTGRRRSQPWLTQKLKITTATTEGYASRPGGAQAELLVEVNKHEADRNLELVLAEFRNYQQ